MLSSIDVIIVNWNSGQLLRDCLASLEKTRQDNFYIKRVTVVDNGSSDTSLESVGKFALPVETILNKHNRGFAAAVNQAARSSTADFLLLLNPDTLLGPDALAIPIAFLNSPQSAEVATVSIQLFGDDGKVQHSCARLAGPFTLTVRALGMHRLSIALDYEMAGWNHEESRVVDHVIGAFYMVRRRVFESLGALDERFFVYFEDMDFSARVKAAGWKTVYLCGPRAYHKGGGITEKVKAQRLACLQYSCLLYVRKHFGTLKCVPVAMATLLAEPCLRLLLAMVHFSGRELQEVASGYLLLWRSLFTDPGLTGQRRG